LFLDYQFVFVFIVNNVDEESIVQIQIVGRVI